MDSATDTDSETDHVEETPFPMRAALSPSSVPDTSSDLKDVHAALQELRSVETSLLVKVPPLAH
jgi:hypothetical protein